MSKDDDWPHVNMTKREKIAYLRERIARLEDEVARLRAVKDVRDGGDGAAGDQRDLPGDVPADG